MSRRLLTFGCVLLFIGLVQYFLGPQGYPVASFHEAITLAAIITWVTQ